MVTVRCSDGGLAWLRVCAPGSRQALRWARGRLCRRPGEAADRDPRQRLAAERVIVEEGKTGKGSQKQAQRHRQRLDRRERQPKAALSAHRLPSKRSAQIVGRLCHRTPRNQPGRRYHGETRQRQGGNGLGLKQAPAAGSIRSAAGLIGSDETTRPNLLFNASSSRGPEPISIGKTRK